MLIFEYYVHLDLLIHSIHTLYFWHLNVGESVTISTMNDIITYFFFKKKKHIGQRSRLITRKVILYCTDVKQTKLLYYKYD